MRKRKAFLGVGLACALLLTMLAGCGAQESSAAPTSEASVKTEQTESQSGNVFTNPDVSIGEGTITVLTNVTEGNRLKELEKYAQEFDAKYPGTQKVEFEAIDDYENQTKIRLSGSDYGDVLLIPNTVDVENLDEYFVPLGNMTSCRNSITALMTALTMMWYTEFRCRCSSQESSIIKRFSRKPASHRFRARLTSLWMS